MDEPRVTPASNAAKLVPSRTGGVRQPSGHVGDTKATTTTHESSSTRQLDSGAIGNQTLQSLAELLPTAVLNSRSLTKAEWAWRQMVMDTLLSNEETSMSTGGATDPLATQGQFGIEDQSQTSQTVMQLWWNTLGDLATVVQRGSNQTAWAGPLPTQAVVPFTQLSRQQLNHLPRDQYHEVLADRLVSSIVSEIGSHFGFGLFQPVQPGRTDQQHPAIRWRAERQTKVDRGGHLIHRLSLEFQLQQWPVQVVFLSAKPSLQVHIRTDHPVLHSLAAVPDETINQNLSAVGWRIERWTVASFQEDGENQ